MNKSIFLTTSARCGTYWVRPILSSILDLKPGLQGYNPNNVIFKTDSDHVRVMKDKEDDNPGGNIYNGHTPIIELLPLVSLVNIIIMIRDPRDICVSAAYFMLKEKGYNEEEFYRTLNGLLQTGGPNLNFNESFLNDREKIPYVMLRYEDMVNDSYGSLVKVLDSFCYKYNKEQLKVAIEKYSFKILSKGRKIGEEDKLDHYRKGIIGDWKNHLTEKMNRKFCEKHPVLMKLWGDI